MSNVTENLAFEKGCTVKCYEFIAYCWNMLLLYIYKKIFIVALLKDILIEIVKDRPCLLVLREIDSSCNFKTISIFFRSGAPLKDI